VQIIIISMTRNTRQAQTLSNNVPVFVVVYCRVSYVVICCCYCARLAFSLRPLVVGWLVGLFVCLLPSCWLVANPLLALSSIHIILHRPSGFKIGVFCMASYVRNWWYHHNHGIITVSSLSSIVRFVVVRPLSHSLFTLACCVITCSRGLVPK